jgi:hypothetical protein
LSHQSESIFIGFILFKIWHTTTTLWRNPSAKKFTKFKFHSIHIPPNLKFPTIPPHHCVNFSYCALTKREKRKNDYRYLRERTTGGASALGARRTATDRPCGSRRCFYYRKGLLLLSRSTAVAKPKREKKRKTIVSLVSEFVAYSIEVGATHEIFPQGFPPFLPIIS